MTVDNAGLPPRSGTDVTATITARRAAAASAGVTPAAIRQWIDKGWLKDPPWTAAVLQIAGSHSRQRAGRGSAAPHGTVSRWTAGCTCSKCAAAHSAETTDARSQARQSEWDAGLADQLIAAIESGASYRRALEAVGVSAQAVTGHRHRDATFAAQLDAALTATRNPTLAHGSAVAWRDGCRCPDCRTWHNTNR